jgi:D-alanyl-D-alanine carboxypeptidase
MPYCFTKKQKTRLTKRLAIIYASFVMIMVFTPIMPVVRADTMTVQSDGLSSAVLIDKSHPLKPLNYVPPELTVPSVLWAEPLTYPETELDVPAAAALTRLFGAAESDGITLVLSSGYRSYDEQAALYSNDLKNNGAAAGEAVAPPGYSEHQSGLAADVILPSYFCAAQGCFALTQAAAWLNQNSYRYGFVVRYPLHKEASTGYEYEPWHLRYLGIPLARQLHNSGKTLEEFYGLP